MGFVPVGRLTSVARRLRDGGDVINPGRTVLFLGLGLVVVNRGLGVVLPACSKYFIDTVIITNRHDLLWRVVAAVLLATLCQGLTAFALTRIVARAGLELTARLRRRLHAHVVRLPLSFFESTTTGVLVSRIMSDVEGARALVGVGLIQFIGSIVAAGVALVLMATVSVTMTLATVVLVGAFAATLSRALRALRPLSRARLRIMGEVASRLNESLGGVRVVKGFGAEAREEVVFASGVQRVLDNGVASLNATAVVGLAGAAFGGLVGASVMLLGAQQLFSDAMPIGTYVMFTMLSTMLAAPVSQLVALAPELLEAFASVERSRELLTVVPEDVGTRRRSVLGRVHGSIAFDGVSLSYDGTTDALHDISFEATANSVTALVGRSGAGKSSIAALLAAFYEPCSGRILVDGVDLASVTLDSYRSQLGYVLQDTFLFDGSIRDNLLFGRPQADDASVQEASRIAHVDQFVRQLPQQYETRIGERGIRLSGGQRQRLSIARAILANPRILIMDEATSSVDSASEALIQEGLRELMSGRTSLVIAHRLSTIRSADQILMVDAGRITARGTHRALLTSCAAYRDLWSRQGLVCHRSINELES